MIINKIIILYFFRHTDDSPSTGTRLVCIIIKDNDNINIQCNTIKFISTFIHVSRPNYRNNSSSPVMQPNTRGVLPYSMTSSFSWQIHMCLCELNIN